MTGTVNGIIRIGPEPFERDAKGMLASRIGTIFLRTPGFVTMKGIHAMQRMAFIEELNARREAKGEPPLTEAEVDAEIAESVDLLFDENFALIRPDPRNMPLALRGDEFLQQFVSKRKIRYLNIQNQMVRDALRTRGEAWRMAPIPRFEEEIRKMIEDSRVGISGRAIYFYNHLTGTRFLTLGNFRTLGQMADDELRQHLQEIAKNLTARNRFANPEVDILPRGALPTELFAKYNFETLTDAEVRGAYERLLAHFESSVHEPHLLRDDVEDPGWRKALTAVLVQKANETGVSAVIEGLSPEFFMQIEWLPGGRVEDGELFFDHVFDEADAHPEDEQLRRLCDHRARAILFNYLREYSQIEYVNIGRTRRSLSGRKGQGPRALVYIVEMKERHRPQPSVKIIRIQRWTVASHLAEGKPLLQSMLEAEDYTDYVMDRRLGARQLGMHLPTAMIPRTFRETVCDSSGCCQYVWTGYFERDYISGCATDKVPENLYASDAFCQSFFRLLGQAAASNLVVGRAAVESGKTIFDDGDEVIIMNALGLPERLVLVEPTGAFTNYRRAYAETIADYAKALNKRKHLIRNFEAIARIYTNAFEDELARIQQTYREHRAGFDALFRDRQVDENGSMAYRWRCVLQRLDVVNAHALAVHLRDYIDF